MDTALPPRRDGGSDAFVWPDAGPPPTGCELLDAGGSDVDSGADGGADAGPELAPAPDAYPPLLGPGGPATSFAAAELHTACAHLDGGERDRDHHNTVLILDGYLYMPWAHEAGVGGLSVFEVDDPCNPVPVVTVVEEQMRETHAAGIASMNGRRYMVTTSLTGVLFWDVTDPTAPAVVRDFTLPGVVYPDSYARVVLSTFWQAPYVYVGGADNGVFIVDASDPADPVLIDVFEPLPELRVGGVHAIGTMLVIQATEGIRTNIVDISDPGRPRFIPGGTFITTDGTTDRFGAPTLKTAYFGHVSGDRAYYARNFLGGGLVVFDISDPSAPAFLGNWDAPPIANGGYVFLKEGEAFVGLSNYAVAMDVTDPGTMVMRARFDMTGDLDTVVPIGNVVAVSVDDDAIANQATDIMPYRTAPDTRAPVVNMVVPRDGTTDVALSARVGVTFDEFVELGTVFRGSFRVEEAGSGRPIDGTYSGQEGAVGFWPREPLRPSTAYEVIVPVGGVTDVSGNAVATEHRSTFTTVACD
jgi:hypothetical protein